MFAKPSLDILLFAYDFVGNYSRFTFSECLIDLDFCEGLMCDLTCFVVICHIWRNEQRKLEKYSNLLTRQHISFIGLSLCELSNGKDKTWLT